MTDGNQALAAEQDSTVTRHNVASSSSKLLVSANPAVKGKTMKTKITFWRPEAFWRRSDLPGQPTVQFHTNFYAVAEIASSSSVIVQLTGETNAEGSVGVVGDDLTATNGPSSERHGPPPDQQKGAIPQFQGEVGSEISYQQSPQVKTDPATN